MGIFTTILASLLLAAVFSAIRILREYERGVVFMLGRFHKVKGPGLVLLIPAVQQMVRVDLRIRVLDVPSQDLITRDNISVKVNAVIYFRVIDPERAIINVENYMDATGQLAQTTLRSVLGQHELDELLAERERLNQDIRGILDQQTDQWGIKVSNVEIKHVVQAARELRVEPGAMQLRYLQTLVEISSEKSSTIVFPLPGSMLQVLENIAARTKD
jgi:regulator of protease activity HflC (stomatin/prohibitin superfamily)